MDKLQSLDSCTTNANVGILLASQKGATVTVGKSGENIKLEVGEPLVIDSCLEVVLGADGTVPVLFAQAWHPEFAAVERTSEIRARAKTFGLAEDEVKAAAQVVNDYAKKSWEKAASHWRKSSTIVQQIKDEVKQELETHKKQAEQEAEAKRKEQEAGDEERQKNLEELEKKRAQRRQKEEEAEKKRLERKKQLEAERANRDPWLNSPEVLEAEKNIQELKEARRDANAKLEFDLSTQLTKDISAAERNLAKVIKSAKKAHKSSGSDKAAAKTQPVKTQPVKTQPADSVESLNQQLQEIKAKKVKASEDEDFAEAKRLKERQQELEAKLKIVSGGKNQGEISKIKQEIEEVKKKKSKASEDEDFSEAKRLKDKQQQLETKLKKLEL